MNTPTNRHERSNPRPRRTSPALGARAAPALWGLGAAVALGALGYWRLLVPRRPLLRIHGRCLCQRRRGAGDQRSARHGAGLESRRHTARQCRAALAAARSGGCENRRGECRSRPCARGSPGARPVRAKQGTAAQIAQREQAERTADEDLKRRGGLIADGAISAEELSHARDAVTTTRANVAAARQQLEPDHRADRRHHHCRPSAGARGRGRRAQCRSSPCTAPSSSRP